MKSKREKILLIATLVGAVVAVYFLFFSDSPDSGKSSGGGPVESGVSVSSSDVANAREEFSKNIETLKKGQTTRQEYRAIAFSLPEKTSDKDAELTFQDQLSRLLSERLGRPPRVGIPKSSEIKNVSDYYFIDCEIETSGSYAEMVKLLQDMEQLGLLIKKFNLEQEGSGGQQMAGGSASIKLTATVSRLVKMDDKMRKRFKRSTGHRGR